MVKDIICLIQGRNSFDSNQYLFDPKIFCLNQTNFVSFKQIISLNQRKSFKLIIFFDSIKSFFSVKVNIVVIEK